MVMGWGITLLMPGDTLSWSPAFKPLLDRAPETAWAVGLTALALVRFAALIINGRLPAGTPVLRGAAAALSAVVWSQFLYGAIAVSTQYHIVLPGCLTNLVLLACELVTIARSTRDFMRAAGHVSS